MGCRSTWQAQCAHLPTECADLFQSAQASSPRTVQGTRVHSLGHATHALQAGRRVQAVPQGRRTGVCSACLRRNKWVVCLGLPDAQHACAAQMGALGVLCALCYVPWE